MNNTAWETSRPYSQVFAKSEFTNVLAQFKEKKKSKQPLIVAAEHTVVQNDYWGVKGGRKVSVTWYYLDECGAWEEQLPKETQKQIKNSGDFDLFPNYKTIGQNSRFLHPTVVELTKEQVSLAIDTENKSAIYDSFILCKFGCVITSSVDKVDRICILETPPPLRCAYWSTVANILSKSAGWLAAIWRSSTKPMPSICPSVARYGLTIGVKDAALPDVYGLICTRE